MTWLWLKLLLAAAAGVFLTRRLVASWRAERDRHRRLLDAFVPLVAPARPFRNGAGLPALRGTFDGSALMVTVVPDSLAFRQLPKLWLEVRWARPHAGRLRLLLRPLPSEYLADEQGLTQRFAGTTRWPFPVEACGSGPEAGALLERIEPLDLAAFPSLKQILITETELRVTMACEKADRGTYRVLRAARFDLQPVGDELVAETLAALRAIEHALAPERMAGAVASR
jgi:hypothetical protein